MTGPEHYKEAERLLDGIQELVKGSEAPDTADAFIGLSAMAVIAQAHATLALAAAVAIQNQPTAADRHAWAIAAGDRGGE